MPNTQEELVSRPGYQTSEFAGKTAVQALMLLVIVAGQLGVDVQLDEQQAILIIAGLEGAYTLGRSLIKGLSGRTTTTKPTTP